jgi:hypothetical protein
MPGDWIQWGKTPVFSRGGGIISPADPEKLKVAISIVFCNLAKTKLNQVPGLEFAPGPAVSLHEFNTH